MTSTLQNDQKTRQMPPVSPNRRHSIPGALLCGLCISVIGLLVLIGWHTHYRALLQIIPATAAMKYNSAFCFLLTGVGLIAAAGRRSWLGWLCGIPVAIIGGLTALEYLAGWHIRIDQFLHHDFLAGQSTYPGRMTFAASICFAMIGAALLILHWPSRNAPLSLQRLTFAALFGLLTTVLGAAGMADYATALATDAAANSLVKMPVHTALLTLLAGLGIMSHAHSLREEINEEAGLETINHELANKISGARWLPGVAASIVICLTLGVWWALVTRQRWQAVLALQIQADQIAAQLNTQMQARNQELARFGQQWGIVGPPTRAQWEAPAALQLRDFPGCRAMAFVEPSGAIRWIVPLKGNEAGLHYNMRQQPDRNAALNRALQTNAPASSVPVQFAVGGLGFVVCTPVYDTAHRHIGFTTAAFEYNSLLAAILPADLTEGYAFTIRSNNQEVFRRDSARTSDEERVPEQWVAERQIDFAGVTWQLRFWPTRAQLWREQSNAPEAALALGIGLALLVALTTRLAQAARLHAGAMMSINNALRKEMAIRVEIDSERQQFLREAQFERLKAIEARNEAERHAALLEAKARELERSNAALQEFASVASHDLKEPLRKIRTFGDLLQKKAGTSLGDECTGYVGRMVGSAARMQSLIDGLLMYSRVSGRSQTTEPIDLNEIVRGVLADLETRLIATKGRVDVEPLPRLQSDSFQMRQLFQNLIGNALKFHREGVPPVVRVAAEIVKEGAGTVIRLTVADNGIGFDPRYASKVFGLFERLEPERAYEGTGIGLALCRKIVEQHGGTISVASTPGEGTTFTIDLPYVSPPQKEEFIPGNVSPAG